jgi:hypothetical protein
MALTVYYEGLEKINTTLILELWKQPSKRRTFTLKFIGSFHTLEQEHFDIFAQYRLGEVDSNIGSETYGDVFY